jgi:hypothetical protein
MNPPDPFTVAEFRRRISAILRVPGTEPRFWNSPNPCVTDTKKIYPGTTKTKKPKKGKK